MLVILIIEFYCLSDIVLVVGRPEVAAKDGTAVDSAAEDGTVEDGHGAAELSKKMVDGPAESHDNPVNTITMDGAELES